MAYCTTGSSPKPGISSLVAYSGTTLAGYIEEWLGPDGIPLAALVGTLSYQTGTLCAADPPDIPSIGLPEWIDIFQASITGVPLDGSTGVDFYQLLEHYAWFTACQCDNQTAVAPTPYVLPTGIPQVNGSGGPPSAQGCVDSTLLLDSSTYGGVTPLGQLTSDITALVFPNQPITMITDSAIPYTFPCVPFNPADVASATLLLSNWTFPTAPSSIAGVSVWGFNSSGASVGVSNSAVMSVDFGYSGYGIPNPFVRTSWPSTMVWMAVQAWASPAETPPVYPHGQMDFSMVCTGANPYGSACCPPDPVATGLLTQILAIVQNIYSIIPERASSYAANPVHAGLVNGDSVTLAATTTALLVTITTFPVDYTLVVSTPTTYGDVGWVTPVTNQGPESGLRLTRSPEVLALPEATIAVALSLPPGEVVSVTELQPG